MCHENEKTTEKKDAVLLNKKIALQSNAESLAESFHRNAQVTPEELLRSRYKYTKNSILKSLPPFPNARGHKSSRNVRSFSLYSSAVSDLVIELSSGTGPGCDPVVCVSRGVI
jgi:hypothetical protein